MSLKLTKTKLISFLFSMLDKGEISFSVFNYLHNKKCRTHIHYLLPKIHKGKTPQPGRPIISAVNSDTENISKFIDHFLNPCATRVQSYIKGPTDFLNILEDLGSIPANSCLVTLDVTLLYTNIGNAQGLFAANEALESFRPNPNVKPSNKPLIQLMEFVLIKDNFTFYSVPYLQIAGTSMGTKMVPSYASVFQGQFEDDFIYTYPTQPLVWKCFIDNCFCIWTGSRESLDWFIHYLNTCDLNIKFTCELLQDIVHFLDTTVYH